MKTPRELATEVALKLYGTSHGTAALDRPIEIIEAAIDAAYEKGRQDEYDEWVVPRKSSPVTEKQVARELPLIPTAQEKLSDGKLRAPVKGNINYPEDAPRHTLD